MLRGVRLQAERFLEVWCLKANGRSLNHRFGQAGALQCKWICGESHRDAWGQAGETCLAAKALGFKSSDKKEAGQL